MTTPWTITPQWTGQTVAVIACGPGLTAEAVEQLRKHRTIVVNEAHRLAPWADMLVAMDGNWPPAWREFNGLRVCGVQDQDIDALHAGPFWERIGSMEFRNSGLAAVRIAAALGASRIILAGFSPETPGRFYDDEVDTGQYAGVAEGLRQITAELTARGIVVEEFKADKPAKKPLKGASV